jgi:hypothetical protein
MVAEYGQTLPNEASGIHPNIQGTQHSCTVTPLNSVLSHSSNHGKWLAEWAGRNANLVNVPGQICFVLTMHACVGAVSSIQPMVLWHLIELSEVPPSHSYIGGTKPCAPVCTHKVHVLQQLSHYNCCNRDEENAFVHMCHKMRACGVVDALSANCFKHAVGWMEQTIAHSLLLTMSIMDCESSKLAR